MRLHSLSLKNYRRHELLSINLDAQRTLIHGPNEIGKSTLIEAIHRCLFYRYKSKAAGLLERMQPRNGGDPEVTLEFSIGPTRYTLMKRFRGPSGSRAVLSDTTGTRYENDAAEEALQKLLGVEEIRGQQADTFNAQWAHLWVWQGSATDDPGGTLTETAGRQLREQLQQQEGLGVIASRHDDAVKAVFEKRSDEIFGRGGKPKKTSRLAQTDTRLAATQQRLSEITSQLNAFREALDKLARADDTILQSSHSKQQAEEELGPIQRQLGEVARLEQLCVQQQTALDDAANQVARLEVSDAEIRELTADLAVLDADLQPGEVALAQLVEQHAKAATAATDAAQQLEDLRRQLASLQERRDLYAAQRRLITSTRDAEEHAALVHRLNTAQDRANTFGRELDEIPALDAEAVGHLTEHEQQLAQAKLAVELMATKITVVSSSAEVFINGEVLPTGKPHTITDTAQLAIESDSLLEISPGGGDSLAAARQAVLAADSRLREALAALSVSSVLAARERLALRDKLSLQQTHHQSEVHTLLGGRSLAEVLEQAQTSRQQRAEAAERVSALQAQDDTGFVDGDLPSDLDQLRSLESPLDESYQELQQTLREQVRTVEEMASAKASLASALQTAENRLNNDRQQRSTLFQRLSTLEEIHGTSHERATALLAAREKGQAASVAAATTQQQLTELNKPALEADQARFIRVAQQAEAALQSALLSQATARGTLQTSGTVDLHQTRADAEAQVEAAERDHTAAQREAAAIHLLHTRFEQFSRERADQVAAPLRKKAEDYLSMMFGPGTTVALTLHEATRDLDLRVTRPGPGADSFAFSELSGGTREQVAAALRLAMAEILAARFDGCLPIVFDDAFTNSDPSRIAMLQRMLDLAASRGLQVIVLSCNPTDYHMLGAHEIDMRSIAASVHSAAAFS